MTDSCHIHTSVYHYSVWSPRRWRQHTRKDSHESERQHCSCEDRHSRVLHRQDGGDEERLVSELRYNNDRQRREKGVNKTEIDFDEVFRRGACMWYTGSLRMGLLTHSTSHAAARATQQIITLHHFTFWLSLSQGPKIMCTNGPRGVNYCGYLHVLKYLLLLLYWRRKEWRRQISLQMSSVHKPIRLHH